VISTSKELALLTASGHKWVRISVGFLLDGAVQALEVLFDQKLYAGLRSGLDANPVAVDSPRYLERLLSARAADVENFPECEVS